MIPYGTDGNTEAWVDEDGTAHAADVLAGDGLPVTATLKVTRLSDVVPEAVSWLWPGRIPAGKLVTLDGDPSLGKSTLAMAFAAIITTGGRWPDGTRCEFPGDVVLLAAEDGLADTIRPRLDAAAADVTRVHAVEGVSSVDPDTGASYLRPPTLADVDALHELVVRVGARLLVVDVLMAYLPAGTDSHKDQDIRRVLSRLGTLADTTGCTVLLLRHLNKAKGGDPMYRGGGSIGIVGAARAGMLVARDPDDDDLRVLASTKSNLGPAPDALTYRLVDGNTFGVARVKWEGTSTHDARALLADHGDGEDRPERDGAAAWLTDYLTEHTKAPSKDVKVAARKEQISDRTLQRAAQQVRVEYVQEGFPRSTYWRLPDSHATTGATDPRLSDRGATGATGATGPDLHEHSTSGAPEPQSRQSRHGSETGRHCTVCGHELWADQSKERGLCARCAMAGVA